MLSCSLFQESLELLLIPQEELGMREAIQALNPFPQRLGKTAYSLERAEYLIQVLNVDLELVILF